MPPQPTAPSPSSHDQIQSDVQALLSQMQTSFKSFSDSIFQKIDNMQQKLAALDSSVADLAKTTETPTTQLSHQQQQTDEILAAVQSNDGTDQPVNGESQSQSDV